LKATGLSPYDGFSNGSMVHLNSLTCNTTTTAYT
jgi:hypothetical protein